MADDSTGRRLALLPAEGVVVVEFRILGPLEVSDDGRQVEIPRGKVRFLLVLLLLRRGGTAPSDRLAEDLWDSDPPRTAGGTLQTHVSHLRSVLGSGRLLTRPAGYQLVVGPEEVDAWQFERLCRAGACVLGSAPEQASELFGRALRLWRGPALAEFGDAAVMETDRARLEQLRLKALEDRAEADLALGHHAQVAVELEALVPDHPLRERLQGQLMLALYRSDRQADALFVYHNLRRQLDEELGIDPSPALQRLQDSILLQKAELDWEPPSPAALEARSVEAGTSPRGLSLARPDDDGCADLFVGRVPEMGRLSAALTDAFAGRGGLALLAGEPGIGKTRMAREFAATAAAAGAEVCWGRCWEAPGAPAFWPWLQVIRTWLGSREASAVRTSIGPFATHIATVVPEVRAAAGDTDGTAQASPVEARFRFFDAVTRVLKAGALQRPLVMVLDDLQEADRSSLLLLEFLLRDLADSRILVLGTYRDTEVHRDDPLSATLAAVAAEPVTRLLALDGLSVAEIGELLMRASGRRPSSGTVAAIHRHTDGNPFFAAELVRWLTDEGRTAGVEELVGSGLRIPPGVSAVINGRLAGVSPDARSVLATAAVIGRTFSVSVVAAACDRSPAQVLRALEEAIGAHLVTSLAPGSGRFLFRHALVRDTVYDELGETQRARLHVDVGRALADINAAELDPHLSELAHHFSCAVPVAGPDRAVEYAQRAAQRATAVLAFEEAARLFDLALSVLAEADTMDGERLGSLLLQLADARWRSGDVVAARTTFLRAAGVARARSDAEQLACAALGVEGAGWRWTPWAEIGVFDRQLVTLLEEALAAAGNADSPLCARLLAALAAQLFCADATDRRRALGERALAMARRVGDADALGYVLNACNYALYSPERVEERLAIGTEIVGLAGTPGVGALALTGHFVLMTGWLEHGSVERAQEELDIFDRLAGASHQPLYRWYATEARAALATVSGRFEEAESLIEQAREMGRRAQQPDAEIAYRGQLVTLRAAQGRLPEAEPVLEGMLAGHEDLPAYTTVIALRAFLHSEAGRVTEARGDFERLAGDDFRCLPLDPTWVGCVAVLAETCAFLGDAERAAVLYRMFHPCADRTVTTLAGSTCLGSAAHYLGLLAATMRRWDDAEAHFEAAVRVNGAMGARPWLVRTCYAFADMLASRGATGDRDRALQQLSVAITTARELGLDTQVAKAHDLQRRLS